LKHIIAEVIVMREGDIIIHDEECPPCKLGMGIISEGLPQKCFDSRQWAIVKERRRITEDQP
jgi:hypothetical protein